MASNKTQLSAANFIDVSKAFDTVDHTLLLLKLEKAGVRGIAKDFFHSYISNRKQWVQLNDIKSSTVEVLNCGVPQGSVLGPILFLLYFNSIFSMEFKGIPLAFADDLALVYVGGNRNVILDDMNNDLCILRRWFDAHFMVLSPKTKCMFFNIANSAIPQVDIIYHCSRCLFSRRAASTFCANNCHRVEVVKEFKYLGLWIDNRLNFKTHIKSIRNYLHLCNRKFYLLKSLCPIPVLKQIYFALVQSKLEYGLSLWGSNYQSCLNSLIVSQKRIIRTIFYRNQRTASLPLFKKLSILPFNYLYVFKVLKLFYNSSGQRNLKILNYSMRNKSIYNYPAPKKQHFKHYHLYNGPKFFNMLPSDVQICDNLKLFLKNVKIFLLQLDDINLFINL